MSPRSRLSLDGQWYFSPTKISNTDNGSEITVPSPWQADERFRDHIGAAWYQRQFEIPVEWFEKERVIFLGFGAVDYFAEVWLNDIKVGEHEGGYLPFELDVTQAAHAGTNTLTVRVDDPLEIFAEIPHGKQSWYGMLSGIWQAVWVESRAATHIQRVKISTNGEQVSVDVNVRGNLMGRLTVEVLAPNGEVVTRTKSEAPLFSIRIERPQAWSPDEPNLYTLNASTGVDQVTETFGFRTIETKGGKIMLNGIPFYLRGALDQDYYPDLISTPPSQEHIEDEFRKAKEMGLNCLRVHIKVADPRYYAAADKLGLLIWTELPNHILLSDEAKRRARETLAGMVERDWNHPSIGIWTIINESWGIDLTDPSQRAWLAETYGWLKALDPMRLVVGNSACWGNFHVATDIADFHIYYAMPDHYDQWRDWTENYARRPGWLFAHEYKDHAVWREFARDPWHASEGTPAVEVHQRGDEPLLVSEFGNWGLPDMTKLYQGNGGTAPWWFATGLEWGDGVVYPRGLEQRFKDYHLDRVFPSLSELSEASQRLQFDALKFEIEQIRRYNSIQGYVITEFTDVHWECNGLLDMYRNPKVYHSRLKEVNSDDLLIPLWERLAFSADETCEMEIIFSHYSAVEIKDPVLRWEVVGPELPLISDQLFVDQTVAYQMNELGVVRFDIPHVHRPIRARLELRLVSGEKVITAAEQELYIFPSDIVLSAVTQAATKMQRIDVVYSPKFHRQLEQLGFSTADDLSRADVAVVATLDDACREFLLRGGRVLLLAEADDALQTYIPGIAIESRSGTPWQGDWASSFGWHRFDSLPTNHTVNFAFADLTPAHVIHGFSPRTFALDVYAGLFVGWLHKPIPTIARKRVGRGELLVSTFRLAKNLETSPLAKHLFCELMKLFT
jgi:Glycosyl hydrolases family 2, sugar binding domain/Glycosyl hydrolases family 2/Glycosyl hydrolases family 2, TIM barrel domain